MKNFLRINKKNQIMLRIFSALFFVVSLLKSISCDHVCLFQLAQLTPSQAKSKSRIFNAIVFNGIYSAFKSITSESSEATMKLIKWMQICFDVQKWKTIPALVGGRFYAHIAKRSSGKHLNIGLCHQPVKITQTRFSRADEFKLPIRLVACNELRGRAIDQQWVSE